MTAFKSVTGIAPDVKRKRGGGLERNGEQTGTEGVGVEVVMTDGSLLTRLTSNFPCVISNICRPFFAFESCAYGCKF